MVLLAAARPASWPASALPLLPVAEDACLACGQATWPHSLNYVTASLARAAARKARPEDQVTQRRLAQFLRQPPAPPEGPGTELKRVIGWTADVAGNTLVMTKQHVVASGSGQVTCVDAATGKLLWSVPGTGTPVVREDAVFVTGQKLNLADGKPVWTAKAEGDPLLSENVVVTQGKDLVGTDATTGKELWLRAGQSGWPAKLRVDGVGYIVTGKGTVVRTSDGEIVTQDSPAVTAKRWAAKVKATGAGVEADGKLFVPTAKALVALDVATGKQVSELALPAPVTGPITLVNGNHLPGATTLVVNTKLEKQWEFAGKDVALGFSEDRVVVLAGGKLLCFGGPTPAAPKPVELDALSRRWRGR